MPRRCRRRTSRRRGPAATARRNPTRRSRSRPRRGTSSTRSTCRPGNATRLIACLGDSITDGTGSTLNGDDRWPDVLARRLHAAYGSRFAVVNAGIGGNRITGPSPYDPKTPFAGGPSALDRLERDVLVAVWTVDGHLARRHQRPVVGRQRRGGDRRHHGRRPAHPRARRRPDHRARQSRRRWARPPPPGLRRSTLGARPSTRSSDRAVCSTASPTSMPRPAIPAPAACAPSSSRTAASAVRAMRCTPIARGIWPWATRSTSGC